MLAAAIARKRDLNAVHLDQLHHLPHTDWQPRPAHEFHALHDEAITDQRWVIEGNYSACMPQRLRRATGVILLDASTPASLFRYLRRALFENDRIGALAGNRDSVKWSMLHHIAVVTPGNRRRYMELYRQIELPKLYLPSMRELRHCYRAWQL
jgi:adenylate kinase family enzyme